MTAQKTAAKETTNTQDSVQLLCNPRGYSGVIVMGGGVGGVKQFFGFEICDPSSFLGLEILQ